MILDPRLWDDATDRQREYLDAIKGEGSIRAAARKLGIGHSLIHRTLQALTRRLAPADKRTPGFAPRQITKHYDAAGTLTGETVLEGVEPFAEPGGEDAGPARDGHDGFRVKGVSTYYDAAGEQRGQWVKTTADEDARAAAFLAAVQAACGDIPRRAPVVGPAHTLADLLNFYVFTDYHLGMRAWAEESGVDWNLERAEDLLSRAFEHLVAASPPAAVGFIAQLGDFLHFDGLLPVTPTSQHVLDSGSQFQEIVRVAIRLLRRLVDFALRQHDHVVILAAEGNHDMASSVWLREILKALYENEPRVTVVDSPSPYYAYRWGRTMLAIHHGHGKKKESLPELFAAAYGEMWGQTTKRYAHAGHHHHEVVVNERSGMRVIQHPTLAPRDSYSSRHGYFSERQTSAITYHAAFGKVGEVVVTPEMLIG